MMAMKSEKEDLAPFVTHKREVETLEVHIRYKYLTLEYQINLRIHNEESGSLHFALVYIDCIVQLIKSSTDWPWTYETS